MGLRLTKRGKAVVLAGVFAAGFLGGYTCAKLHKVEAAEQPQAVYTCEIANLDGIDAPTLIYAGEFKTTAYCACEKCCGKWADGYTASGAQAVEGVTVAVDSDIIPLGTVLQIGGREYVAQDTGSAIKGNRIDIFFNSHAAALAYGVQTRDIYIKGGIKK